MPKGHPNIPVFKEVLKQTRSRKSAAEYAAELERSSGGEGIGQMEKNLGFRYFDDSHTNDWTPMWAFEDNVGARLAQGWRMVENDQVIMSGSVNRGNTDLGEHVTRPAKMEANGGNPGKMFLLEIPTSIHKKIQQQVWDKNDGIDKSMRSPLSSVENPENYQPKGATNSFEHKEA